MNAKTFTKLLAAVLAAAAMGACLSACGAEKKETFSPGSAKTITPLTNALCHRVSALLWKPKT